MPGPRERPGERGESVVRIIWGPTCWAGWVVLSATGGRPRGRFGSSLRERAGARDGGILCLDLHAQFVALMPATATGAYVVDSSIDRSLKLM